MMTEFKTRHLVIPGLSVSPGYAIGPASLIKPREVVVKRKNIEEKNIPAEIARFNKALEKATKEIKVVKKKLIKKVGEHEAKIFDAHTTILSDPEINDFVEDQIKTNHINAEYAYNQILQRLSQRFSSVTDEFFKERLGDIESISKRVLGILQPGQDNTLSQFREFESPSIVIMDEISPFYLGQMDKTNTLGFIMEKGGKTSHVSILARSMDIPALSGIDLEELPLADRDMVILDSIEGLLIIQPTAKEIAQYETKKARYFDLERRLFEVRNFESRTRDNKYIELSANIELPVEVDKVLLYGGTSVGLYRSEYLFITQQDTPTEDDQYQTYKYLAERIRPGSVVIRTFDSGGDKLLPQINVKEEMNPFMGWRSIRVCLDNTPIFKTQLRAILRASTNKNIRIMFPMITEVSQLLESRKILAEVMKDLDEAKIKYNKSIKVGCMIEVPAAVFIADELAKHCDFFSIGTNDLIQFTLAVDRGNKKINNLFEPHHPAVLKLIQMVAKSARKKKIPVSICGEMAGNPLSAILLIGLGIEELSMRPSAILEMKKFIRSNSFATMKADAESALNLNSPQEVNKYLEKKYLKRINKMEFPSKTG